MKECPKHPNALIIEAWKYYPLCGSALVESIAGMPVIMSPAVDGTLIVSIAGMPVITSPAVDGTLIVSAETLNNGIGQALKIAEDAVVNAFLVPVQTNELSDLPTNCS